MVTSHDCKKQSTRKITYDIGEGSEREVQDTCFSPRRSLKRSPPPRRRSTLLVTQSDDGGASPQLRRSSRVASQSHSESSISPSISKRRAQMRKSTAGNISGCEAVHTPTAVTKSCTKTNPCTTDGGTPYERRVQATCFTPRRSLKRSSHKQQRFTKEPHKVYHLDVLLLTSDYSSVE